MCKYIVYVVAVNNGDTCKMQSFMMSLQDEE